ncbi:ribbon-helix-helix protein, CopG family [Candidatus Woesearchaeota archaeon]|nr:ribbon-helix-helix protein, CopG family [Candidatus Woesearchaeota archaeon]
MVMDTMQIRLTKGLIKRIDYLVETGMYSSRSDAVRDAVRNLVLKDMVGIIPNKGDSIKEIRNIRKKLSKEIKNFKDVEKINKLGD